MTGCVLPCFLSPGLPASLVFSPALIARRDWSGPSKWYSSRGERAYNSWARDREQRQREPSRSALHRCIRTQTEGSYTITLCFPLMPFPNFQPWTLKCAVKIQLWLCTCALWLRIFTLCCTQTPCVRSAARQDMELIPLPSDKYLTGWIRRVSIGTTRCSSPAWQSWEAAGLKSPSHVPYHIRCFQADKTNLEFD